MARGSVLQRHLASCPRGEDGKWEPHRCRGAWEYKLYLGRSQSGRRVVVTKGGFETRREALAALEQAKSRYASGVLPSRQTVREYLDQWLASKRAIRPTTLRSYTSAVRLYIVPAIGAVRLDDLRAHHVDLVLEFTARGHRGRPVSVKTVRIVHGVLRSALNAAVRRRLIPYNPAEQVELPPSPPHRHSVWSVEQARTFLACTAGDRLAALWRLLLVTGMRRGEAVGLRWDDVDLDAASITIRQQVVDTGQGLVVSEPKTRRSERVLAIDRVTVAALRAHREAQEDERRRWGNAYQDNGYVFAREDGRVLRPEYVTRRFQALSREAGLPVMRLHDLRH